SRRAAPRAGKSPSTAPITRIRKSLEYAPGMPSPNSIYGQYSRLNHHILKEPQLSTLPQMEGCSRNAPKACQGHANRTYVLLRCSAASELEAFKDPPRHGLNLRSLRSKDVVSKTRAPPSQSAFPFKSRNPPCGDRLWSARDRDCRAIMAALSR